MEIEGTVYAILPAVTGQSPRGNWVRQEMVIEHSSGEYTNKLALSFWGDKTSQLSSLNVGERVKASFDVVSRESNGRWFTTAQAWRVERGINAAPTNFAPPVDEGDFNGGGYNEPF